jgi:hypothetical protein
MRHAGKPVNQRPVNGVASCALHPSLTVEPRHLQEPPSAAILMAIQFDMPFYLLTVTMDAEKQGFYDENNGSKQQCSQSRNAHESG